MKFYRPKSILRLILTGFSLVALPLIIGLVYATISVDRLVSQSQHTLLQSVLANQGSQVLVDGMAKPGVARFSALNWFLEVGGDSIGLFGHFDNSDRVYGNVRYTFLTGKEIH